MPVKPASQMILFCVTLDVDLNVNLLIKNLNMMKSIVFSYPGVAVKTTSYNDKAKAKS